MDSNRDWHTASELYQERKLEMDREEGAETQRPRRTKIRGGGDRVPGRGGLGPREGARDQLKRRQKARDRGGGRGLEKEGTDTIERSGPENRTEEEDSPE